MLTLRKDRKINNMGEYLKHYGVKGMRWGKHLKRDKQKWINGGSGDEKQDLYVRNSKDGRSQEYVYRKGLDITIGNSARGMNLERAKIKMDPFKDQNRDYVPAGGYTRIPTGREAIERIFKGPTVRKALNSAYTSFFGTPEQRSRAAGVVKNALTKIENGLMGGSRETKRAVRKLKKALT